MAKQVVPALLGFLVLFGLYHAAEFMILFRNIPFGFLAFQLLFFAVAWLIAKWQSKLGFTTWGLNFGKHFLRHLLLGMVTGSLLYGLTFMISVWLSVEKVTAIPATAAIVSPLSLFIFGNFFSSFSEDILTRGYVYNHLNGMVSNAMIVLISATIYVLNHIYRLGESFETHSYLFLLGILYIIPLVLTKRLWFTGGMHWAGNVTFYFTHEILKTEERNRHISPNYILIGVILTFIPLTYYVLKKYKLIKVTGNGSSINK